MHPIAAFCRRNLNALGLELYSIAYPLLPKDRRDWLFEKNVNIVPAETGVKIIDRDEESITIGKFNKDGTYSDRPFRILTTTDIHLGDTPSLRRKAMQMLANHIAQAKPDLVIFTGDIILSKFQQLDSVQFARFMEKTGVYWAIVFGNHEVHEEKGFYKWLMLDSMRRYPHCLALHGDDSLYGYGNYRIDIKNGENSLLQSLYLFDSGRDIRERYYKDYGVPEGMKGYDFLKPEQIEWYKNCVRRTEEKYRKVKSMMYFHIPLPEFEHVMKLDENGQYVPTGEAKITKGYRLPAAHVIHTVGPVYRDGGHHEPELLASCYRNSLRLAVENGLKTIAFPCISTGVYRYPKLEAARIAFREITRFLAVYPGFEQVIVVCFGPEDFNIYNRLLAEGPEA